MRVFLTGVSGHLGRCLATHLLKAGYQVLGSSRRPIALSGIDAIQLAIGDPVDPAIFTQTDTLIHLAHDFAPGAMDKNIAGTLAFQEAAAAAGVRQQIFVTSYSARPEAQSEYGRTKYRLEQHFQGPAAVLLRLGLVIGPGGLFARQRRMLLRTPIVPLIGAGTSPVAVIASSHVRLATETIIRNGLSGAYSLFYEPRPTQKQYIQEIKKLAHQHVLFVSIAPKLAVLAVSAARAVGLPIDVDPGQIKALQLNEASPWKSDLAALLPGHEHEFHLRYALRQIDDCET